MLLRTLVALSQPRQCLDVGCFSGYTSAAILEALPKQALLTAIDIEPQWTALASDLLLGRNVEFMCLTPHLLPPLVVAEFSPPATHIRYPGTGRVTRASAWPSWRPLGGASTS